MEALPGPLAHKICPFNGLNDSIYTATLVRNLMYTTMHYRNDLFPLTQHLCNFGQTFHRSIFITPNDMYCGNRDTFIGVYRVEEARELVFTVWRCCEVWKGVCFSNVEAAASMKERFDLLDLNGCQEVKAIKQND